MPTLALPEPLPLDFQKQSGSSLPSIDTVRATYEALGKSHEVTELVTWFIHHGRALRVRSFGALGELIGYDGSTISRVLNGKYEGNLGNVLEKIAVYRAVYQERATIGQIPFQETKLAKEIWTVCDFTRIAQTIAFLYGPNQTGKTSALQEYQRRNNHGQTIFVRVPVGGNAGDFLEKLADACGLPQAKNRETNSARIHKYLRPEMLILVDEVHQLFKHGVKTRTIEAIRELHDLTRVGIVLCGTQVLAEALEDHKLKGFLGQLANRGTIRRLIKPEPYREDVLLLCTAYGFPVPAAGSDEEHAVFALSRADGLGKLCKVLEMATRYAQKNGVSDLWRAFLITVATLRAWAEGKTTAKG